MGETNNDNIIYIDHIGLHRKDVKINKMSIGIPHITPLAVFKKFSKKTPPTFTILKK